MRRALMALVAGAALMFGALPAAAAAPTNSSINGAEAQWYFVDQAGMATGVLIRPVREVDSAGGHDLTVGVNVQVEQAYTDPVTGEDVFRLFVSRPYYAPATSISVDRMKGASVRATVSLYEQSTGAGPYSVSIAADWTPVGDTTRKLSNVWDTEGGMWHLVRSNQTSAPAMATGSMSGAFNYGSLGEAEGILMSSHDYNKFTPPPMYVPLRSMLDVYSAESRDTFHINGADASWNMNDARSTFVVLGVTQNHTAAGVNSVTRATLEIYAGYYDAATTEDVWFDVGGTADLPGAAVDPSLQGATLSATISVSGFEYRSAAGSTKEPTETVLGPLPMTITTQLTASGPITHWRKLFIERGTDYSSKDRYYSRARLATTTGTVEGSLIAGALDNAANAFTYDETETVTTR